MAGKERHKLEAFAGWCRYPSSLGNQRITDGLGWKGSLKDHLVPPCCLGQQQLPLAQVAPSLALGMLGCA